MQKGRLCLQLAVGPWASVSPAEKKRGGVAYMKLSIRFQATCHSQSVGGPGRSCQGCQGEIILGLIWDWLPHGQGWRVAASN